MTENNYTTAEALGSYSRELAEQGFDDHLVRDLVRHAAHVLHNKDDMVTFTVHPPKVESAGPFAGAVEHVSCAQTIRALQKLLVMAAEPRRCDCLKHRQNPARGDA